jgi:hypothetical protein
MASAATTSITRPATSPDDGSTWDTDWREFQSAFQAHPASETTQQAERPAPEWDTYRYGVVPEDEPTIQPQQSAAGTGAGAALLRNMHDFQGAAASSREPARAARPPATQQETAAAEGEGEREGAPTADSSGAAPTQTRVEQRTSGRFFSLGGALIAPLVSQRPANPVDAQNWDQPGVTRRRLSVSDLLRIRTSLGEESDKRLDEAPEVNPLAHYPFEYHDRPLNEYWLPSGDRRTRSSGAGGWIDWTLDWAYGHHPRNRLTRRQILSEVDRLLDDYENGRHSVSFNNANVPETQPAGPRERASGGASAQAAEPERAPMPFEQHPPAEQEGQAHAQLQRLSADELLALRVNVLRQAAQQHWTVLDIHPRPGRPVAVRPNVEGILREIDRQLSLRGHSEESIRAGTQEAERADDEALMDRVIQEADRAQGDLERRRSGR